MHQNEVPELTPEVEKMAKEVLLRQLEDQYGVEVIIVEDNVRTDSCLRV